MNNANPIRADSLEINEAEDGLVVYDPAEDMVHHLNPSAALIFDLCDGTRDVATSPASSPRPSGSASLRKKPPRPASGELRRAQADPLGRSQRAGILK